MCKKIQSSTRIRDICVYRFSLVQIYKLAVANCKKFSSSKRQEETCQVEQVLFSISSGRHLDSQTSDSLQGSGLDLLTRMESIPETPW